MWAVPPKGPLLFGGFPGKITPWKVLPHKNFLNEKMPGQDSFRAIVHKTHLRRDLIKCINCESTLKIVW
ncbi:hypothetical protein HUJ04_011963 [Dendroctonus ponderosae]|nr:hypothetical protein HUJ04_011963 [Dendroctonus ponderosae]KAH1029082.1 hypothetical protein HUJ05_002381 [Dendroctonus ponderosae]